MPKEKKSLRDIQIEILQALSNKPALIDEQLKFVEPAFIEQLKFVKINQQNYLALDIFSDPDAKLDGPKLLNKQTTDLIQNCKIKNKERLEQAGFNFNNNNIYFEFKKYPAAADKLLPIVDKEGKEQRLLFLLLIILNPEEIFWNKALASTKLMELFLEDFKNFKKSPKKDAEDEAQKKLLFQLSIFFFLQADYLKGGAAWQKAIDSLQNVISEDLQLTKKILQDYILTSWQMTSPSVFAMQKNNPSIKQRHFTDSNETLTFLNDIFSHLRGFFTAEKTFLKECADLNKNLPFSLKSVQENLGHLIGPNNPLQIHENYFIHTLDKELEILNQKPAGYETRLNDLMGRFHAFLNIMRPVFYSQEYQKILSSIEYMQYVRIFYPSLQIHQKFDEKERNFFAFILKMKELMDPKFDSLYDSLNAFQEEMDAKYKRLSQTQTLLQALPKKDPFIDKAPVQCLEKLNTPFHLTFKTEEKSMLTNQAPAQLDPLNPVIQKQMDDLISDMRLNTRNDAVYALVVEKHGNQDLKEKNNALENDLRTIKSQAEAALARQKETLEKEFADQLELLKKQQVALQQSHEEALKQLKDDQVNALNTLKGERDQFARETEVLKQNCVNLGKDIKTLQQSFKTDTNKQAFEKTANDQQIAAIANKILEKETSKNSRLKKELAIKDAKISTYSTFIEKNHSNKTPWWAYALLITGVVVGVALLASGIGAFILAAGIAASLIGIGLMAAGCALAAAATIRIRKAIHQDKRHVEYKELVHHQQQLDLDQRFQNLDLDQRFQNEENSKQDLVITPRHHSQLNPPKKAVGSEFPTLRRVGSSMSFFSDDKKRSSGEPAQPSEDLQNRRSFS